MRPVRLSTLPWYTVVTTGYQKPGPERTFSAPVFTVAMAVLGAVGVAGVGAGVVGMAPGGRWFSPTGSPCTTGSALKFAEVIRSAQATQPSVLPRKKMYTHWISPLRPRIWTCSPAFRWVIVPWSTPAAVLTRIG